MKSQYIYFFLLLLLPIQPLHSANFVVRSKADAGIHTLRWAIVQSNTHPGPDIITFDIPGDGPHIIFPSSALPLLTDPAGVIIDGLSQPSSGLGKHPPATMQLRIVIDGSRAGNTPGIWILSPSNQVKGLVINNYAEEGIRIQAIKSGTSDNVIRHCIVGLDANGVTTRPNGTASWHSRWAGISIVSYSHSPGLAYDNLVFGNVISGNAGDGILLSDCMAGRVYANRISGNYIGSTLSGNAAAGNQRDGILLAGGCYGTTISGNMIVANGSDGVHLVGDASRNAMTHHNIIRNNVIGITFDNKQLGNALNGISIGDPESDYPGGFASDNILRENTIAANGMHGVCVWEHPASTMNADRNRISQNAIFANAEQSICLSVDSLPDAVYGRTTSPNNALHPPSILETKYGQGVARVRGSVNTPGNPDLLIVELYKCQSAPNQCFTAPLYLGTATPNTDGVWYFSTNGLLDPDDGVIAVVIDEHGNTSEYSSHSTVTDERGDRSEYAAHSTVSINEYDRTSVIAEHQIGKRHESANALLRLVSSDPSIGTPEILINVVKDCWGILEIYSEKGELVLTLVDRWLPQGEYAVQWDLQNWFGRPVQSGNYICQLDAGGVRQTKVITIP